MKKFLTMLFTLAVACSLSLPVFAQTGGGSTDQKEDTTTGKKAHKGAKKGHKGGKKSKKGATDKDATPAPK